MFYLENERSQQPTCPVSFTEASNKINILKTDDTQKELCF